MAQRIPNTPDNSISISQFSHAFYSEIFNTVLSNFIELPMKECGRLVTD